VYGVNVTVAWSEAAVVCVNCLILVLTTSDELVEHVELICESLTIVKLCDVLLSSVENASPLQYIIHSTLCVCVCVDFTLSQRQLLQSLFFKNSFKAIFCYFLEKNVPSSL